MNNNIYYIKRNANASNIYSNTYFSIHSFWFVKIYMGPIKFTWDPHDFVGPMWILTNQKKCVEKYVLEYVASISPSYINPIY